MRTKNFKCLPWSKKHINNNKGLFPIVLCELHFAAIAFWKELTFNNLNCWNLEVKDVLWNRKNAKIQAFNRIATQCVQFKQKSFIQYFMFQVCFFDLISICTSSPNQLFPLDFMWIIKYARKLIPGGLTLKYSLWLEFYVHLKAVIRMLKYLNLPSGRGKDVTVLCCIVCTHFLGLLDSFLCSLHYLLQKSWWNKKSSIIKIIFLIAANHKLKMQNFLIIW